MDLTKIVRLPKLETHTYLLHFPYLDSDCPFWKLSNGEG